jgi:hypothetical protein
MCRAPMDMSRLAATEEAASEPERHSAQLFELFQQLFGSRHTTTTTTTENGHRGDIGMSSPQFTNRVRQDDFTGMYS